LVKNDGLSFSDAKTKARNEVLAIFSLDEIESNFEDLDISEVSSENDKLIAISSILLQTAHRRDGNDFTVTEGFNFFPAFISDFETDGILNSEELHEDFANAAHFMNFHGVRANLTTLYGESNFDNFHDYIYYFSENTDYELSVNENFPTEAGGITNLLSLKHMSQVQADTEYCFAVNFSNIVDWEYIYLSVNKTSSEGSYSYSDDAQNWSIRIIDENKLSCSAISENNNSPSTTPLTLTFSGHG
jgi:hypothetical protein